MIKIISQYKDDSLAHTHSLTTNPDDKKFYFHTHDICEFILVKNGDASAIIGDRTYKLQRNSLVIFRANIPHRMRIDGSEMYERHNILFDEEKLANGIFNKFPSEIELINCSGNKRITDLFEKLDYYYSKFSGENLKILVENTIEEIVFNLYVEPFEEYNVNQVSSNPVISKAVEYIDENYSRSVTIEDIAKEVCVTKSHLHHLFMENLKISPKKYINMKRLSKAQKLIISGAKPTSIYTECGFTDYGTFFRNYTSHFGYTPSQKDKISIERNIES